MVGTSATTGLEGRGLFPDDATAARDPVAFAGAQTLLPVANRWFCRGRFGMLVGYGG